MSREQNVSRTQSQPEQSDGGLPDWELSDRSQVGRIEAAREAKEAWSARLAALEDGTLQWIEGSSKASFTANDLAGAFHISPQAANNRLVRLVKAGAIERYRTTGANKHLYHRKLEFWEKVPIDLMWRYLQVTRLRALLGARKPDSAQQICRVIADEVTRILAGEDPAGYIAALVRETEDAVIASTPPAWTSKQRQEVADAFE